MLNKDLKAAIELMEHCYFPDAKREAAKNLLITHATRHSDNVEAVTDEKRKATEWHVTTLSSLAKNIENKDTNAIYYRGYETVNVLNEVCAALKQPDKTVEVLKGVRDAMVIAKRYMPVGKEIYDDDVQNDVDFFNEQLTALSSVIDGKYDR